VRPHDIPIVRDLFGVGEGTSGTMVCQIIRTTMCQIISKTTAVWSVVEQSAREIGIERFGAHDLRRTCANVWSAALSQAKSDLTVWSAQMYSTFGGVYDSWPGWNALRPLPI
jgi:integrase